MTALRLANQRNASIPAVMMRAEALSRKEGHVGAVALWHGVGKHSPTNEFHEPVANAAIGG
jgi:hypothetical protein